MPSRNLVKLDAKDQFYHVYSRGINKEPILISAEDYSVFLNLLKRHLTHEGVTDKKGREYAKLYNEIELNAYCLMENHFHLLLYQFRAGGMVSLLRRILTAYTGYFNKKYDRIGPLFQSNYKATSVDDEQYLWHISRYIHLNPKRWEVYPYSSYEYYIGRKTSDWVNSHRILDMHVEVQSDYRHFMQDYQDHKESMESIQAQLADI